MLACILNTKPEKSFSSGAMVRSSLSLGMGGGAMSTKQSSNSCTPKLFNADPKNTGCCSPFKYASRSKLGYTSRTNSNSSNKVSLALEPIAISSSGLSICSIRLLWLMVVFCSPSNKRIFSFHRLYIP